MAEPQDIEDIRFIDEDEDEDKLDEYMQVKHSAEPLNKAGSQINSDKREKCFVSATTEVDKSKNREMILNTAGCIKKSDDTKNESDVDCDRKVGPFDIEVVIYKDNKDGNTSEKMETKPEDCFENSMEIISPHTEVQAYSDEKSYDTDSYYQNKQEQYDNQAKHKKSSLKRKSANGEVVIYKDNKDGNTSEKMETKHEDCFENSMEIISPHTEVQAYSDEKSYDTDSYYQNKQEQYDNQAKQSSLKRKSVTGDDSPVQESKDPAADYKFANAEITESTERACSSSHKVNTEGKNVEKSREANDEGPDTNYIPEGEPMKHQPKTSAIDNDKPEKAVESEQDGSLERKNNDNGCDVDTGKHGKECKGNSKQDALKRLHNFEKKTNATEGPDGDVSAYYSKDNQDAVSLKTAGKHKKCSSSLKQEKGSKTKKDTHHTEELSKSGNWNREKMLEQDESDVDPYYEARENAMEKYVYFWRGQDVYSQWHKSNFYANGQKFTCAEQYMMYKKAELFEDFKLRGHILKTKDPRKMKALGRKVSNFDELFWRSQCLYVVKEGNIEKFSQNKEMEKQLFKTYPKVLVEASPFDQIWGIGLDENSPEAYDESTWDGLNLLGFILTEVRDELMFKAGEIEETQKKVYLEELKIKYCAPLEYFSSVGADKTEESEEASRSKPGSDDRHEMNNDNNEEVVRGETKISKAEQTKKVMGAWGKKSESDGKHTKNKNMKENAYQTKSKTFQVKVFPGSAQRQEISENMNEAKGRTEMPGVQERQQNDKQRSQVTTKTIVTTSVQNRYNPNPEIFDIDDFPPLSHEDDSKKEENVVSKPKSKRNIKRKKENDNEVQEKKEERESMKAEYVEDSFSYKQTELADASCDEHIKTDSLLAVFQIQENNLAQPSADPTKEFVSDMHEEKLTVPEVVKGLQNCRTLIEERKSKDPREVKTETPGKFTKKSHSEGHPPSSPTKPKPNYQGQSYHKKGDNESDNY